jgi:hypothetical protein
MGGLFILNTTIMIKLYSYHTQTNFDSELIACGIYAHSQLENKLGYDIVCPLFDHGTGELKDIKEDGIYDVEVIHHEQVIPAKLYYWKDNTHARGIHRGLVVLPEDEEGVQHAKKRYDQKASIL